MLLSYLLVIKLTQSIKMKLSAFIVAASVVGGSFFIPITAKPYSCSPYTAASILERMLASGASFEKAVQQAWRRGHLRDEGCLLETMGVMKQSPAAYPIMHATMRNRKQ